LRRKILDGLTFFLQAKAASCVLTPATRWRSSWTAFIGNFRELRDELQAEGVQFGAETAAVEWQ